MLDNIQKYIFEIDSETRFVMWSFNKKNNKSRDIAAISLQYKSHILPHFASCWGENWWKISKIRHRRQTYFFSWFCYILMWETKKLCLGGPLVSLCELIFPHPDLAGTSASYQSPSVKYGLRRSDSCAYFPLIDTSDPGGDHPTERSLGWWQAPEPPGPLSLRPPPSPPPSAPSPPSAPTPARRCLIIRIG